MTGLLADWGLKTKISPTRKGISGMKLSRTRAAMAARFDDPKLVAPPLVPVLSLAEQHDKWA